MAVSGASGRMPLPRGRFSVGLTLLLLQLFFAELPCPAGASQFSKWELPLPVNTYFHFGKILFSNTTIFLKFSGNESTCDPSQSYTVSWYLRYSYCYNEVFNFGVYMPFPPHKDMQIFASKAKMNFRMGMGTHATPVSTSSFKIH